MPNVLQYMEPVTNAWIDAPAQMYARTGTAVQFRLVLTPQTVPPTSLATAVWSNGVHADTASYAFPAASAGLLATQGAAVSVEFGGQTVRTSVTVFGLTLQVQPVVATQTAPRTNFGVDERMNLSFVTVPAGVTAVNAGGLTWRLQGTAGRHRKGLLQRSAPDRSAPVADGLAYYIAPDITDDMDPLIQAVATKPVTLELAIDAGPARGQSENTTITIHRPTGVMTAMAGRDRHTHNQPSAGFRGAITFTPNDVSFSNLEFREASGALRATGCFKGWAEKWDRPDTGQRESSHTPTVIGLPITRAHNTNQGVEDDVWTPSNAGTPAHVGLDGTYQWDIYWQYRVRTEFRGAESESWIRFQVATHRSDSDAAGRCVTSKAGAQVAFNLADPTAP